MLHSRARAPVMSTCHVIIFPLFIHENGTTEINKMTPNEPQSQSPGVLIHAGACALEAKSYRIIIKATARRVVNDKSHFAQSKLTEGTTVIA